MQNILLIGGSGKQSGAVYLPVLLSRHDVQLTAIADPVDPFTCRFTSPFAESLHAAGTRWISLQNNIDEDLQLLEKFITEVPCDTVAISCPPLQHLRYVEWGLKSGMDIIVDKPIICFDNQFGDSSAPARLRGAYAQLSLVREFSRHKKMQRTCHVMIPLMRRVTMPYTTILQHLHDVYLLTSQNLTYMLACRGDGCYRFADEFDRPGAHGYRDGLGTLTMSAYHFLDFMSACLTSAPPKGSVVEARLVSKTTVGDIRQTSQDVPFGRFLNRPNEQLEGYFIGDNAELDFSASYCIGEQDALVADCELFFSFVQRGCTRRVSSLYSAEVTHDEGLTNDCVMVIHQGPLQSFQCLVAHDPSTEGRMSVVRRLNPLLASKLGVPTLSITDTNLKNNENTMTNRTIIGGLLDKFSGRGREDIYNPLDLKYQELTMELFTATIGASTGPYSVLMEPRVWINSY